MKLRVKIFIILLAVALVPMFIITSVAYMRYTQTTYDRIDEISKNSADNAAEVLDNTLGTIEQSASVFTFYEDSDFSIINNLLQFSDPDSHLDAYSITKANNNIQFVCRNILFSYDYIYGLYVFTPSGALLSHSNQQNGDVLTNYQPVDKTWYRETISLHGKTYISHVANHAMFSGKKDSLFFSKALYDVYSHKFLGVLVIDCSPTLFDLSSVNTMPDMSTYRVTDRASSVILYDSSTGNNSVSGSNIKTYKRNLSIEDLVLTASFNYDALYDEFSFTGVLLIIICIICSLGVILISAGLAKNITYPIEHLSRKMAQQQGSHPEVSAQFLDRTDEIGTLYNEYNSMIDELNASIKKDYLDKLISLDSQMRSLEAQINSHFLFNTLESINSLAELDEDDRISSMVLALGNMFRYTIKTQSELVTVEDELSHVNDYNTVQQIRFDGKFDLDVRIPESMMHLRVLKLILQPLVENALNHGLNYCTCGDTITIDGRTDDTCIYLSVSDNGAGMEVAELQTLQQELRKKATFSELGHRTKQSIGLKNIHSRIELYYGTGYGLSITSSKGNGTTILIKLPLFYRKGTEE